jgi:hypothetical protein
MITNAANATLLNEDLSTVVPFALPTAKTRDTTDARSMPRI